MDNNADRRYSPSYAYSIIDAPIPAAVRSSIPDQFDDQIQLCVKCQVHKPRDQFLGSTYLINRYCRDCQVSLIGQRFNIDDTEANDAAVDSASRRRFSSLNSFRNALRRDLYSVPVRENKRDSEEAYANFQYFLYPNTEFVGRTMAEIFGVPVRTPTQAAREDPVNEPTEFYKYIVGTVSDITGYSLQRHSRYSFAGSTGGWSTRYRCGQSLQNATKHVKLAGSRARNVVVRKYYNCKGLLSISGTSAGVRISYQHFHIHIGRHNMRRASSTDNLGDIYEIIDKLRPFLQTYQQQLVQSGLYPALPPSGFMGTNLSAFIERQRLLMLYFATSIAIDDPQLQRYLLEQTDQVAQVLARIFSHSVDAVDQPDQSSQHVHHGNPEMLCNSELRGSSNQVDLAHSAGPVSSEPKYANESVEFNYSTESGLQTLPINLPTLLPMSVHPSGDSLGQISENLQAP
ncbi:uncharacterized protein V1516DRAFT_680187 [Lipomyces oligophaga]|uniref:uncharacterized protein n=1 Tax=Lipomyces oligophaga TaxID=45792 RepID=UPI0034CD332A